MGTVLSLVSGPSWVLAGKAWPTGNFLFARRDGQYIEGCALVQHSEVDGCAHSHDRTAFLLVFANNNPDIARCLTDATTNRHTNSGKSL